MNDRLYVLHVVGRMDRGGTETLLMSLLRQLDRNKFQYDIVEQTSDICDYDEEIRSLGSIIYRCPHIAVTNLKEYRAWWKKFYIEHPEYVVVHGHSRGSASIYLDEANKAGRVTIAHCHNNSHGKGIKGLIRYVWQLPLRNLAQYNFACSYDSGISQFGKNGKFEVINNGIDTIKYRWNPETRDKIRQEMKLSSDFVVGNVARFEEQKNHRFLIEVFAEIKRQRADAILMLVGKGTKEQEIHAYAKELRVEDSVIYTGVRDNVNELLQAMDVFVLPSLFEGLGIVNVEAQAAGLPTFTSDKVVAPEVKLTELLHFVPLESGASHWAEVILNNTITENERRDTAREIVDAGFDIHSTAKKLEDFYLKVSGDAK